MNKMGYFLSNHLLKTFFYFILSLYIVRSLKIDECMNINNLDDDKLMILSKAVIPELEGKIKGEAGKIGIIGGSTEYTGAPYFAAISALKIGADLIYVITSESAAPVIKSYSPDLIVYPFLNIDFLSKIKSLLPKMGVVIIGPGLGREDDTLKLIYEIIQTCKILKKPLVIDADGLYAVSKNISILQNYPSPGVILTPNSREAKRLMQAVSNNNNNWHNYWGQFVTVLVKGEKDEYLSNSDFFKWSLSKGGSGRRAGGQGDILAGTLGTFYNWALNVNLCENEQSVQLAQSVAAYASAKFTRTCNYKAFKIYGRSMTASDMLKEIHSTFEDVFN